MHRHIKMDQYVILNYRYENSPQLLQYILISALILQFMLLLSYFFIIIINDCDDYFAYYTFWKLIHFVFRYYSLSCFTITNRKTHNVNVIIALKI